MASYLHSPSVTQRLLLFDLLIADSLERMRRINPVLYSVCDQGCLCPLEDGSNVILVGDTVSYPPPH